MTESGQKHSQTTGAQIPGSQSTGSQTRVKSEGESHAATPSASSEASSGDTGLMSLASHWLTTASSRAKVMVELVLAEARLAAISMALMAFLAMLSAAFVLGAWGLLIAGVIYGLLQLGLHLWPVLFVLCLVHVVIALLAWRGAVKLSDNLEFPATRKQFQRNKEEADEMAESKTES